MAAASIFGGLTEIHARFKIQDLRWGRGAQRPGGEKSAIENLRFENRIRGRAIADSKFKI
jgi:hypothetical protein